MVWKRNERLIRAGDLQQYLQQTCSLGLLLGYGCASVSIISPFSAIINRLVTNTYRTHFRFRKPMLYPTELRALIPLTGCH